MYYDELYHHGILGMHWGIRRYQNKDGSLTAEGIKRYRTDLKFQKKYDKYISKQSDKLQKKQENEELKRVNKLKSKNVSDLTEEELNERIRRANLEKLATDLEKQYQQNVNTLNDMATSPAKKFVMNVGGRLLENAVGSIGNAAIKEITDTLFPDKKADAALAKELENMRMTKRELGLDIKKQQNTILFNSYNEKIAKKAAEVEAARNAALAAINAQKQSLNTPVQNIQTQNTPVKYKYIVRIKHAMEDYGAMSFSAIRSPKKNDRKFLMHFGIPKMQWGIRRFQNYDGTLTPEGRERYGYGAHERALKDEIENSWMYDHSYDNFVGPREEHFSDVVERAMKTGEDISDRVLREFGYEKGAWKSYDSWKDGRDYARMVMDNMLEEGFREDERKMRKESTKAVNSDYKFDDNYYKYDNEANQYARAAEFVNSRKHDTWFSDANREEDAAHQRDWMHDILESMGETSIDEIMKMYK